MLNKQSAVFSPPALEKDAAEYIIKNLENIPDVHFDAMGNVTAHIGGKGAKLLISANLDEIGFMVTHIDDSGFLRFALAGALSPNELIHSKVVFGNGTIGVICFEKGKDLSNLKTADLFIDCGFSSKEEAEKHISISDMAVFCADKTYAEPFSKKSPLLCALLLTELAKEIKNATYDLYFAFTVQKEVGFRGITPVINAVMPEIAISLCAANADDIPGGKGEIKLGGGAVISLKDARSVLSPSLVTTLRDICEKNSVPYQLAAFSEQQTEAPLMQSSAGGTKAAAVCIPVRYRHLPHELVKNEDITAVKELIKHFILGDCK